MTDLFVEKRKVPFVIEEAKFSTQKIVTYVIFFIFAAVVVNVIFMTVDQSERSTIIQTIINLTFLAAGFWIGSSKGAADNRDQLNKMLTPQTTGSTTISTAVPKEPAQ